MNNELIKEVYEKYPSGVKQPYDEIIELIGLDNFLKLCNKFEGGYFYVAQAKQVFKESVFHQMRKEFNGSNYVELGVKYGFSVKTVRNAVDKKERKL